MPRTFLQATGDATDATTYTFASQNLGTASADRYIVVCFHTRASGTSAFSVTSVTVAGVAATIVVERSYSITSSSLSCLAIAAVPSGTSGNVVVVVNRTAVRASITLYSLTDLSSATPLHTLSVTGSTSASGSLNVDNGVAIGNFGSAADNTITWTELVRDVQITVEASARNSSASKEYTSASTPTISASMSSGAHSVLVAASWTYNPAGGAKPWLYRLHTQTIVAAAHLGGLVAASSATLTHLMGIGGVTDQSSRYRARGSDASTLKIEYSPNADLTGSTLSSGVVVQTSGDFTGGEAIASLSANTRYYYSIVVDGVRAHSSPFPSFRTFPTAGVAADVVIAFGSCMTTPDPADIFGSIAANAPTVFLHVGDFGYPDSTALSTQRTNYKTQYASNFLNDIVRAFPRAHTWDDHDYGGNNVNGDLSGKANSLQAFKEYIPTYAFGNATQGIWQSFQMAHVEVFVLDMRYQKEGVKQRFPATATLTADTGSSGTSLVLRASDSPSGTDDAYRSWYVDVGGMVRRITGYVAATRVCTLSASVSGLSSSSTYYLRRASHLDMDGIADDQVDWLIAGITGSSAVWKIIASSSVWNPTSGNAGDSWGDWDADRIEQRYLVQELTSVNNIIVLSGDRHVAGIDNGTNSVWPEATSSPMNKTNSTLGGTWSNGKYTSAINYGLATFNAAGTTCVLTIKNRLGATPTGITPLTVNAV